MAEYLHKFLLTPKKRRINLIEDGAGKCGKENTMFTTWHSCLFSRSFSRFSLVNLVCLFTGEKKRFES